jgi:hypothetical protein
MGMITWNIPREMLFALKGSTEEVGGTRSVNPSDF